MSKILAWIGGVGGLLAILGTMIWGVPYYIDSAVEDRLNELAEGKEKAPVIVALEQKDAVITEQLENIEGSQVRIENKVDAFSQSFLAYLERQAQRL